MLVSVERTLMSNHSTPDLDRLVGGEQDGLPPAPVGAPDDAGTPSPEQRFVAPDAAHLDVDAADMDAEDADSSP